MDIIAAAAIFSATCLCAAFWIKHRSNTSMAPRTYTILSAFGQHASVVLYPQPFGKGIDREGNTYRITGDTAHLIGE